MKTKKTKKEMLLDSLAWRRNEVQRERDTAIKNKEWSKVPGWDGVDIGLLMAEKIVNEEM